MNQFLNTIEKINAVQNAWTLIIALCIAISTVVGFIIWTVFFYRKEFRLFRNLKRKVYFLKINGSTCNLEKELKLVSENGFFISDTTVRNYSNGFLDTIKEKAVVIIGYSPTFNNYQNLIASISKNNFPVLVFSKPGAITSNHNNIFSEYPYLQVCNFSSRLLTSLFDICAITPYDKK